MSKASVRVPVTYCAEWQDGYGARGWKLDAALDDPEVIAATAETGRRLPTSVLVHDILDHHLCGLALGGHRNEAIALHQLGLRTGSDPLPDITQMVDEDLMHGGIVGETMSAFLPEWLHALLPDGLEDNQAVVRYLIAELGRVKLREALVQHMIDVGHNGACTARARYQQSSLVHEQRGRLGLALQGLLARIDAQAVDRDWEIAHGEFELTNDQCSLHIDHPQDVYLKISY